MVVYIEYALLENFLFDGVLLCLAHLISRQKIKWQRVLFSALFGAVFAVLYPLLRLPNILGVLLKLSVGFLLVLLSFGRIKSKKEWGRYAFTAFCFFALSFGYGGALTAMSKGSFKEKTPSWVVFIGFALLAFATIVFARKLYEKRALHAFVYKCRILYKQKVFATLGYLDSGNLATKNGLPVCFLSPELVYEIFGEEIMKGGGQVCDKMQIRTMSGEKNIPLYRAAIEIEKKRGERAKKEVYFAPSKNMISREYKVLLHAATLEG